MNIFKQETYSSLPFEA